MNRTKTVEDFETDCLDAVLLYKEKGYTKEQILETMEFFRNQEKTVGWQPLVR